MKVSYTDVPLGDGNAAFTIDETQWTFTINGSLVSTGLTLTGTNAAELRRFLARMSAAMDVAGFADLEPPE